MIFDINRIESTDSTNNEIRKFIGASPKNAIVLAAEYQTAGRGRSNRTWSSPKGNLYTSILIKNSLEPKHMVFYSFAAGLSVADVIRNALPDARVELKWPNDVLLNGKKTSGILIESTGDFLIIGIGINVEKHPEEAMYPVTSLNAESNRKFEADYVLDELLKSFDKRCTILHQKKFDEIRLAWHKHALKGMTSVKLPNGNVVKGEFLDITPEGNLRLTTDNRVQVINSGDIFI
ncbi:MAG: biotin--[acetyl-CoA-carboxylase] ligase [Alphaproteobacteria bacterium]|nr:biotin--[acetyl-CoA-carboxylase] ligase [Alphaproteobacteria bacterium]MCL2505054.1 biotin--[acetyl-CoA-carboxylase] ligase [Alphaproteobacteria bacterium]